VHWPSCLAAPEVTLSKFVGWSYSFVLRGCLYFRVRAASFDHTARGALSPPRTSRRWDRQLRDKPETEIRGLRKAALRTRGNFGKPGQEGVPGLQRGPKAKLHRPTTQSSETIVTSEP